MKPAYEVSMFDYDLTSKRNPNSFFFYLINCVKTVSATSKVKLKEPQHVKKENVGRSTSVTVS